MMMITIQPSPDGIGSASIRALSSISREQVDITAQAVHASGRAWHAQAFDDYDGYLSILIEPIVSDDGQKTFFVSGTAQRLELFQVGDDDLFFSVASFSNANDLSATLIDLIDQQ